MYFRAEISGASVQLAGNSALHTDNVILNGAALQTN